MRRHERARLTRLDGILSRLDAAEKKALQELRDEGFPVRTVHEARMVQAEYREAARLQAHAISRMTEIESGKRTA